MTVQEAITRADGLKENDYTTAEKIVWINQIESRVLHEIIYTHVRHFAKKGNVLITEMEGGGCTISFENDGETPLEHIGTLYGDFPYTEDDLSRELVLPHLVREIDIRIEKTNAEFEYYGDWWEEETFGEIYVDYIHMQIDYYNQEVDRYNNSAERFNQKWQEIKNYYTFFTEHNPAPTFHNF